MAKPTSQTNDGQPSLLILNQMAGPMTWELAEDLVEQIGSVAVLTGHPDSLAKGSQPGLALHRSFTYRRGSLPVRFFSWLCYSVHAFLWLWKWPAKTSILLFSNPPIGLWMVRLIHALRRTPYAVMVHDIFPDVLVRKEVVGEEHIVVRVWRYLNRAGYQKAELILTLGEFMGATVASQFDPAKSRCKMVEIIPPWSDDTNIKPISKSENWFAKEHEQVGKLTFMYSGNMGLGHDLESMVDAASRLEQDSRAHFMFIGAGPKWEIVEKSVQEQRLANVTMLGWQDESVLPYSLATADVGLVSLEQELSGLAVPSKAFYFLAAHVPLIAVCDEETELAKIVQEFGCGVVVPPQHPDRIVEVIESIQADPGIIETWRESAKTAMKSFQRSGATRRFAELLHRDLGTPLAPAVEGSDSPVVDPIPTTIQ